MADPVGKSMFKGPQGIVQNQCVLFNIVQHCSTIFSIVQYFLALCCIPDLAGSLPNT